MASTENCIGGRRENKTFPSLNGGVGVRNRHEEAQGRGKGIHSKHALTGRGIRVEGHVIESSAVFKSEPEKTTRQKRGAVPEEQ